MDEKMMEFEANFSVLDRYGTDITKEEFITNPAIGRDEQIRQLILILLTPEKSAILIGKPGIGKTAIVEGLAYRLQNNDVPEALLGYSIVNIKTASLLGTMPSGESKVQKMIDELKTKEKLILFIDEIHMLIGATDSSSLDFANIFKEGLGRGSIKVIGATTTEEYERYILRDKAFTRRFQKVDVPEPSRDETVQIMMGTLPKFEKQTGRKMKYTPFIQERIMGFLVDITSEYKRVYALGSRYPDVCLTLLKQAFSYTVYDNRPYMDIFDVRKAIENTKNVYPDVIKKELPNFDKMFNDIILEEKGEKPIEEWRKDDTLTRKEQEEEVKASEQEQIENNLEKLENAPSIIDRKSDSIISDKYSLIGSTSVSQGLNEKINRGRDSKKLDDILLSGELGVIKDNSRALPRIPVNYRMTEEVQKGVSDSVLLGKPIQSTINDGLDEFQAVGVYRQKNGKKGGNKMNEDRQRPVRQDISTQNFDKYSNYFSQNDNSNNGIDANNPVNDFLPKNSPQSGMNPNMPPQQGGYGPMNNNMPMNNGPMNGGMMQGGYQNNGMNPNMPPQQGGYGPMNNNMPMNNGPMNGGMMQGGYNRMNPNMPPQQGGYGPMNNNMPMNGPMNGGMMQGGYNRMNPNMPPQQSGYNPNGGMYPNNPNQGNFAGAPMYNNPPLNNFNNIPNNGYGPMNNQMPNNTPQGNSSFLDVDDQSSKPSSSRETLFGAPMYSDEPEEEDKTPMDMDTSASGDVDIYGQLITDSMRIKNGKIVDEFPTFDKLDNLSNIKTVINDVRDANPNNMGQQQSQKFGIPADSQQGMNQMPPQGQQSFLPPMNEYDNPQMAQAPQEKKNWTFIDDSEMNQDQTMQVMNQNFEENILDLNKKEESNILPSANTVPPTSNRDYYEDMKSAEFVNLNDLNNGKIKEEDSNKYMGIPISENKPQFDLNIEGNNTSDGDNHFDDFYE